MVLFLHPMLTGAELIDYVKQNPHMSRTALARATGYVTVTKKGNERVLAQKMYDALLVAKGLPMDERPRVGKVARYSTTVHKNGIVLIGKTYVQEFGIEAGDELEIVLEDDAIRLVPKGATATAARGRQSA
jgi:AbrB family looped-hinge helix DNA binding protein